MREPKEEATVVASNDHKAIVGVRWSNAASNFLIVTFEGEGAFHLATEYADWYNEEREREAAEEEFWQKDSGKKKCKKTLGLTH